jgi:hypothetical protein
MTIPALIIGLILSTLYGAVFHLWRGGGAGRLLLYLILSWIGFWAGHFLGEALGWNFFGLGALNAGMATLGSLLFLGIGYWLSLVDESEEE